MKGQCFCHITPVMMYPLNSYWRNRHRCWLKPVTSQMGFRHRIDNVLKDKKRTEKRCGPNPPYSSSLMRQESIFSPAVSPTSQITRKGVRSIIFWQNSVLTLSFLRKNSCILLLALPFVILMLFLLYQMKYFSPLDILGIGVSSASRRLMTVMLDTSQCRAVLLWDLSPYG